MTVMTPTPKRGVSPVAVLALAGVALLAVVYVVLSMTAGNKTTVAPPAPASADAFDRAAFDTYWATNWAETSWGRHVTAIDRDQNGMMTARTQLFPDAEAQQPALSICGAILTYFGADARPPAVRVLDHAGNILASRRTGEATCSWRR